MMKNLNNIIQKLESGSRPKGGVKNGAVGIPSLGAEHLNDNGGFNFKKIKYIPNEFFTNQKNGIIEKEDILIVKDGATTGKVAFVGEDFPYERASINEHVFKVSINTKVALPKYVYWHLFSEAGKKQILKDFRGATVGGISRSFVKKVTFPLPFLEEQARIVKILDKADALCQKRKQAIELLDDYVNATFFNMFVNNSEEKNIQSVKLEKLSLKITDGVHAKPKYTESGVPFISVKNITTKNLIFDDCKFISLADHQKFTKRCKAELDDILYTKVGATYGRACIVNTSKEFSLYVSVALIKPMKDLIDPIFLKAALNSSYLKRQADKSVKGAGVPDLHLIEIKKFRIPLPSIEDQKQFAKLVLKADEIKQKMLTQSKVLETQFQALMQNAFKGEL